MTSVATKTFPGETPILDREHPLPPRTVAGSGLYVVLTVWLGAVAIVAACWLLEWPPNLHQWILTDIRPWFLDQWTRIGVVVVGVSLVAAFYAMLAIHELGHVVAGLCAGFRFQSLRIGPLVFHPPFRVSLYRGPGAFVNGVAEMIPVAVDKLVCRGIVMVLGGPVANFVSAAIVLLLPVPLTFFSVMFIVCSIANGFSDLIPFESRLGVSDGRRIWMLLRQPEHGERWLALLRLGGELYDGVLPESLSADFLAKATAVRDDSADTVKAYGIAFATAFHQHKDGEAAQRLETCLAYSGHATPVLREALMSDAAVFQARRWKRADLADQWLAEIPIATRNLWFRSRAEAAILEVKGDVDGATRKLAEVEAMILAFPNNAQREALLKMLQRWKSDLCRS